MPSDTDASPSYSNSDINSNGNPRAADIHAAPDGSGYTHPGLRGGCPYCLRYAAEAGTASAQHRERDAASGRDELYGT